MLPLKKWSPELSRERREERIYALLERVGLSPAEDYVNRFPHQLSGGEQQRDGSRACDASEPRPDPRGRGYLRARRVTPRRDDGSDARTAGHLRHVVSCSSVTTSRTPATSPRSRAASSPSCTSERSSRSGPRARSSTTHSTPTRRRCGGRPRTSTARPRRAEFPLREHRRARPDEPPSRMPVPSAMPRSARGLPESTPDSRSSPGTVT